MTRLGVIGGPTDGNVALVRGLRTLGVQAALMTPGEAREQLRPGDSVLVRLDVLTTLDGVEAGLEIVADLPGRGIHVLNRPETLLDVHDKWRTAARLAAAGLPHPITAHLTDADDVLALEPPVVLKPRFGSWGKDVWRCSDLRELRLRAEKLPSRAWFRRHGVLVQDLLPSPGYDLRLLVGAGELVGAVRRVAAAGEWRTNTSVGGHVAKDTAPPEAVELALRAAGAFGTDLAGVDLVPGPQGFSILELNGAVEFTAAYSLPGRDVYADIVTVLHLLPVAASVG